MFCPHKAFIQCSNYAFLQGKSKIITICSFIHKPYPHIWHQHRQPSAAPACLAEPCKLLNRPLILLYFSFLKTQTFFLSKPWDSYSIILHTSDISFSLLQMETRTESSITVISSRLLYIQYIYLYFSFCLLPLFLVPPPTSTPLLLSLVSNRQEFYILQLRLRHFLLTWGWITLEGVRFLFNI